MLLGDSKIMIFAAMRYALEVIKFPLSKIKGHFKRKKCVNKKLIFEKVSLVILSRVLT